tara:strand:- start:919 stop:1395 length:477 start_codon:yes stop_codon:yes gene_type:complete
MCSYGWAQSDIKIDLPDGYIINSDINDEYVLLSASKIKGDMISASIEIKFSDDWSFAILKNKEYISQMLNNKVIESQISMLFDNAKVHQKKSFYLKGIGDCFFLNYSGNNYNSDVRISNLVIQFIKNNRLYTLTGSSIVEDFSSNFKDFLKSFDTLEL